MAPHRPQRPRRGLGELTLPLPGNSHKSELVPFSDVRPHLTFSTGAVWRYLWNFTGRPGGTFRTMRSFKIGE